MSKDEEHARARERARIKRAEHPEIDRAYRERTRETKRAYLAEWRAKNRDKLREQYRAKKQMEDQGKPQKVLKDRKTIKAEYRARHREEINAYARARYYSIRADDVKWQAYRAKRRDYVKRDYVRTRMREYQRKWQAEWSNREKRLASEAKYRANHREQLNALRAEYRANHREQLNALKAEYRARKRAEPIGIIKQQLQEIQQCQRQKWNADQLREKFRGLKLALTNLLNTSIARGQPTT